MSHASLHFGTGKDFFRSSVYATHAGLGSCLVAFQPHEGCKEKPCVTSRGVNTGPF